MMTVQSAQKIATTEDRKALLAQLGVPDGQATVERRKADDGDHLVVRLSPEARPAARPQRFRGHDVRYEPLRPAVAW
ncbi:hypothetical protein BZG35_08215 [Brevundimonas sp. LM2]|nr:hypothetical protein BZG35_08215 [Brevundimonas sp. LM2]